MLSDNIKSSHQRKILSEHLESMVCLLRPAAYLSCQHTAQPISGTNNSANSRRNHLYQNIRQVQTQNEQEC